MIETYLFQKPDSVFPSTYLRDTKEFGYQMLTLVDPPRRLLADSDAVQTPVSDAVDLRRVQALKTPAQLLQSPPADLPWLSLSRRSVARLNAYYLIAED